MKILLHTIALEPARWTPQKVSSPLRDLIPRLAQTPFRELEIFEPHLAGVDAHAIRDALSDHGLTPTVLSSYIDFSPAKMSGDTFPEERSRLLERIRFYDFQKVRLFPCPRFVPGEGDAEIVHEFTNRISSLAECAPDVTFLLETHDHSLADDAGRLNGVVSAIDRKNVGLLWQPTVFKAEAALAQFAVQKPFVRHFHLQNRDADGKFVALAEGVVPWASILSQTDADVSIEFVASGICAPSEFDLDRALAEAAATAEYVRTLETPAEIRPIIR